MRFFGFLFVLLLTMGVRAEEACEFALTQPADPAYSTVEPQFDVDSSPALPSLEAKQRKIRELINFTGNAVSAKIRLRDQKMARINHYLGSGNSRRAILELQDCFYAVEKSYRMIEAGSQDVANEQTLGKNITEYVYFRRFLEKVVSAEGTTRSGKAFSDGYVKTAQQVLEQIGIESNEFGVAFAKTGLNKSRPDLAMIVKAYNESEVAIETKLNVELWAERFSGLKALFSAGVFQKHIQAGAARAFEAGMHKVPALAAPFRLIATAFRDAVARNVDLYKIRQLVANKQTTYKKLSILRSMWAAEPPGGTLLVSFMRFQDDEIRETWTHLYAEAQRQAEKGDPFTKRFWSEIQEDQETALVYRPLSEYYLPKPVDTLAMWIVTGTGFSIELYDKVAPHDWPLWHTVDALLGFFHHIM